MLKQPEQPVTECKPRSSDAFWPGGNYKPGIKSVTNYIVFYQRQNNNNNNND